MRQHQQGAKATAKRKGGEKLTSLVSSRTSTSRAGASVANGLGRRLGFDTALGAAHGVLVDRLDGGLGRVILLVVTYMKEAMSILATVQLKHRVPEGPALVWIPIPLETKFSGRS